jgi:hypothetical protein
MVAVAAGTAEHRRPRHRRVSCGSISLAGDRLPAARAGPPARSGTRHDSPVHARLFAPITEKWKRTTIELDAPAGKKRDNEKTSTTSVNETAASGQPITDVLLTSLLHDQQSAHK